MLSLIGKMLSLSMFTSIINLISKQIISIVNSPIETQNVTKLQGEIPDSLVMMKMVGDVNSHFISSSFNHPIATIVCIQSTSVFIRAIWVTTHAQLLNQVTINYFWYK